MNWLKKLLALDVQEQKLNEITSLAAKLLEKENTISDELQTNFVHINKKIEATIANNGEFNQGLLNTQQKVMEAQELVNSNSLEFKIEMNKNLSSMQKEVELFSQKQQQQIEAVKIDVTKIVEEVLPKPFDPNYKLVDPLDINKTLFSFEVTDVAVVKKTKISSDMNSFLQTLGGAMPNLISSGLLANSYRFVFPTGISGQVMQLANGQGTAIMQGGQIVKHGAYASNFVVAGPLIVFNIGSMIIQQHYLAKINANLDQINLKVSQLIELEFIKKHAKIESIIYFLEKAHIEFSIIENNRDYRSAILSNLVRTNIEIFELIQFYKKSLKFIDKTKTVENELNFKYFIVLHSLFHQGKLLELKYASEYNEILISNLKTSFIELNKQTIEFLEQNKSDLNGQVKVVDFNKVWYDVIIGKKAEKENKIKDLNNTGSLVDDIILNQKIESDKIIVKLENFRMNLLRKQEFVIENGELYEVLD